MNLQALSQTAGPWAHLLVAEPSVATDALWQLERTSSVPLAARVIRGPKATTVADFFDETAAALQFPYYFGENWDACLDCLTDLSWLRAEAYVLLFADAVQLLSQGPEEDSHHFLTVLAAAQENWHKPQKRQPVRPFHVVFHARPGQVTAVRKRWEHDRVSLNKLG